MSVSPEACNNLLQKTMDHLVSAIGENASISSYSGGGFNLVGDKKSIDEFIRLDFLQSRLIALQGRLDDVLKENERLRLENRQLSEHR